MEKLAEVSVLGTTYTIYKDATEKDKAFMKNADGITDYTTKEIFLAPMDSSDPMSYTDISVYERRTIRHEIVHAFFFESGLDHNAEWPRNEEIVDWIAIQFPKLAQTYQSIKAES